MNIRKVDFFRHNIDDECIALFAETARQLFISTGPRTAEFESAFSAYLGLPHVVGTMSCTHSLFLAYRALGIGPGDEVIVPAMTFVATAEAVLHAGALPVFADVDPRTGIMDPDAAAAKITRRTKAICPVHLYGVVAPMDRFRQVADAHQLFIVEDAAHCIEGRGPGYGPGMLGDAVAFSFYSTKNITCGEGGAVATRDTHLAEKLRLLRNHGISRSAIERFESRIPTYDVEEYGYKSNMYDLQAALLLPQIKHIDANHNRRVVIMERYNKALGGVDGIRTPYIPEGVKSALHLYTIRVSNPARRDDFVSSLMKKGIGCSVNYRPLSQLTYYRDQLGMRDGDFPNATAIGATTITLPFYPSLTDEECDYVAWGVAETVRECL